jgi:hypothetical protein
MISNSWRVNSVWEQQETSPVSVLGHVFVQFSKLRERHPTTCSQIR